MNKKGFTLIELLAVIVILAIIALIATPAVLNIIEDSKESAARDSAMTISKAAETYYVSNLTLQGKNVGEIDLTKDTLQYKGKRPEKGYVEFDEKGNAYLKMYINGYCVESNYDNKVTSTKMDAKDCTLNTITIPLDLAGGELDIAEITREKGVAIGRLPEPTKRGYIFKGWFDKDNNPVTSETIVTEDLEIHAYWTVATYTVSFDTTGGYDIGPITVTYGEPYGYLEEPTRPGYIFSGWMTTNGVIILDDTPVTIARDHTLIAQWTQDEYVVVFEAGEGTVDIPSKFVQYNSEYGYLPEATRPGYTFEGWFYESVQITENSIVEVAELHVLVAGWAAKEYTISFETDGGSYIPSQTILYDNWYGYLEEPTKDGYEFAGWYDENNELVTFDTQYKFEHDTTLFASWISVGDIAYHIVDYSDNVLYSAATLQDAINNASAGDTIKMIANDILEEPTSFYNDLTLDTNGFTLEGSQINIMQGYTLKIFGNGTIFTSEDTPIFQNDGILDISDVTIYNTGNSYSAGIVDNSETGTVRVWSGNLYTTEYSDVFTNNGTILTYGGTLKSNWWVIRNQGEGQIYIKGGTLESNGAVLSLQGQEGAVVQIVSGTLKGVHTAIDFTNSNQSLTIGEDNGTISNEDPVIIGETGASLRENSTLNFYDGVIYYIYSPIEYEYFTNAQVNYAGTEDVTIIQEIDGITYNGFYRR